MKKIISFSLSLVMIYSMTMPVLAVEDTVSLSNASQSVSIHDDSRVTISEVMSFEEMVIALATSTNISYGEALSYFPRITTRASQTFRTLTVTLDDVGFLYSPSIDFYCETSESGGYWGILNIYSVQLNREDATWYTTKQFSGTLSSWLRSPYEIEYLINGDFYNNGTTTITGEGSGSFGIDDLISLDFSVSISSESNHFAYCYKSETVAFQW